ncbi:CPBP family intramembrane metalloprotease domain-containing protein [Sedimentitalea sp. CY04]|uniref:CPBP family intramembrane metalloprotease domain-containing protein n=1 Tax=Parasedimentitalea denitrificans TaxID=2211118 RepID=A0ABX0W846_9RHOB|nr:type II CAAX endopeptidase family protein [Sedimentitalea sp. CY04]NIZ60331.1 CPBP family intramembrane metalloprotease domain-containing protein [Sedimentitalea sp. CY04]
MPFNPRYTAHEALVTAARVRPQLWRLVLGLIVVIAVVILLSSLAHTIIGNLFPGPWMAGLQDGSNPAAMLVLLGGFGFAIVGVSVAARILQKRSVFSITGPPRTAARQFAWVSLYLIALGGVLLLLPPYQLGAPMVSNLPALTWLALLPLSLTVVLVQTGAEEILFRGYIQQGIAARFRHPLIWLMVPSVLFALGHYVPAEAGENATLIAIWAGLFGFLMADLTARAGTLGPAIAVHFFNNIAALLLFASPTSLNSLALYLLPYEMSDAQALRPWLVVDFVMMGVCWLAARLAIRR